MENQRTFVLWLSDEIKDRRGWSLREFASRAGLNVATVSLVLSGKRKPGVDFCKGVVKAFPGEVTQEEVMRKAGLLPQRYEDGVMTKQMIEVFGYLPPDEKQAVLDYAEWRLKQSQQREDRDLRSA